MVIENAYTIKIVKYMDSLSIYLIGGIISLIIFYFIVKQAVCNGIIEAHELEKKKREVTNENEI